MVKLNKNAVKYEKDFEKFNAEMEVITDYYFESRYPVGYEVEFEKNELKKSIKVVTELSAFAKSKL